MGNELEKFNRSIGVLVKAYMNDTLQHSNCHACAVGNLIADSIGVSNFTNHFFNNRKIWCSGKPAWMFVFVTGEDSNTQEICLENYDGDAKYQIDSTGYLVEELAKIEYAFETAPKGKSEDEYMFNGLMAVVEVLADIHKVDLKTKEKAKLLFV